MNTEDLTTAQIGGYACACSTQANYGL